MPFRDRDDAGRRLADALAAHVGEACVVYALPRGGVPVAAYIAERLKAPLDLVLVRKIGVPYQPELAMGAIANGGAPIIVRNEDVIDAAEVTEAVFDSVCARERAELERRRGAYLRGRARPDVAGKLAVVVDDGVATGATTRAALRAVRALQPRRLILAIPVAPTDALVALRHEADAIVCLEDYRSFGAIGFFYENFRQIEDEEVIEILDRFSPLA